MTILIRPRSPAKRVTLLIAGLCWSTIASAQTVSDPERLLGEAQASLATGNYSNALKVAENAIELFHKAGNLAGEGRALNSAGLAQIYSGAYVQARDSFTKALNIARQQNDGNEVIRLNNLGNVDYFQGHYSEALARYQEARQRVESFPNESWFGARRQLTIANIAILYQTLGQYERALDLYNELLHAPKALPPSEHAQLLANVGALRRRLGDPQKALNTYREAQALFKQSANRDGELAVLNNIGIVQARDLSDLNGAIATFTTSFKLAEQSGSKPMTIYARLYRGESYYRAGRIDDSRDDFQAAVDSAAKLGQLEETWKGLYGLARISAKRGDLTGSDALLRRALEAIESLRARLKQSSLRSDFLADKRDVYDLLIDHANKPADVFELMEQSRARTLQDRRQPRIPKLADLARGLPDDTVLLEYWLGSTSMKCLAITNSGQELTQSNLTPEQIKGFSTLSALLSDPAQAAWRNAAGDVAQQLLVSIKTLQSPRIRRVIVIPDDVLARIPFESLPFDSELFIQRYSVSYMPSASLLRTPTRSETRWPWQTTLKALADPRPGAGSAGDDRPWAPLPYAVREVTGIAQTLSGRAAMYTGSEARKARLTDRSTAPVLHLATHAYADANDSARSYVLFAPTSPGDRYDRLYLREVEDSSLESVDLVTASACETDVGKLVRGEGVESFSRAFLAAGARSVVTSLWSVGDRTTADLMLRFYAHLERGEAKADALRAAKLETLKRAASAHPANWAAFVLNGEGRTPIPYVISWRMFLTPLLIGASVLAYLTFRRKATDVGAQQGDYET